jgi:hypothetical protein
MGYVISLGCSFRKRGTVVLEAVLKTLQRSLSDLYQKARFRGCDRPLQLTRSDSRRKNRRVPVALLVFLAPYLPVSASSPSEPLHYQLASDPSLHGKGKDGECMNYALALSSRLAAHGIHGRLIFYRWHIRGSEAEGSHVFVLYHLSDRSEWIVDNEIPHPLKVPADASLMRLVFLLSDTESAPVDVELQNGLNRLSFF